ncbi:N-terminal methylation site [Rubrivivax sp. A210]|nr:N-terminal methylation site [Rubrivivax sp. A210]
MVVLVLLAVVLALAAPGLRAFVTGQRVKAMVFDLTSDLLRARSEALTRNASVTIAPRAGQWRNGWTVSAGADEILTREAATEAVSFDGAPSSIVFNVNGRVASPGADVRITVAGADGDDSQRRCIELDLSGRARAKTGACT